jgi:hypothetical protein
MINPHGWVGWGINPVTLAMEGTQALIAFQGEYAPTLQTYNLTAATLQGVPLTPGRIELNFTGMSAEMIGADMTIFATLHLRPNQSLELNHVWNQGQSIDISTLVPGAHAMTGGSLLSASSINMATGISTIIELTHQKLKNVGHTFQRSCILSHFRQFLRTREALFFLLMSSPKFIHLFPCLF